MADAKNYWNKNWPGNLTFVDSDVIAPYPCQTCHALFRSRIKLATHLCDPYARKPEPKKSRATEFTDDQVRAIRKAYADGNSQSRIAEQYGVRPTTIGRIVRRERRADVLDEPTT